ncbi:MAG: hypothetical protein HZB79_00195 [Deltaproteobacteria bacterium]|nr:hypothetical protein [Deltaproteobacteria bacterium]
MWYKKPVWKKEVIFYVLIPILSLIILSSETKGGEDFLKEYWKRPIPFQILNPPLIPPFLKGAGAHRGTHPKDGSDERGGGLSLHPEACGECHKEQYNGWKGSLHSRAVGPGLLGQIDPHKNPEFAMSCYFCHAPMEEQTEVIIPPTPPLNKGGQGGFKNPNFDNKLKLSGVSCSVCHLREGKVYVPPKRKLKQPTIVGAPKPKVKSEEQKKHDFIEKDFFEKAEFCAACHQLDEGYELNGKVLTNTYREWKESIYGKNNVTCQNCHMPDRQHLWRGIHDAAMVRKGIAIDVVRDKEIARLVITNTWVGHYFPTYATPLVVIKGFMLDKKGIIIQPSVKEAYVGRHVSLDLSEESYDTRIAPQKTFEFDYAIDKSYNKNRVVFEVWVYPDEFYNRFYKEILNNMSSGIKKDKIKKALKITEKSHYLLYKKVL